MLRQVGGAVVNPASVGGPIGSSSGIRGYNAGMHGVVGRTRSAALEHAKVGIRVSAVCPGTVTTPTLDRRLGADAALTALTRPRRRSVDTALFWEVAAAVVWLCSDAASCVTGLAMPVEGTTSLSSGSARRGSEMHIVVTTAARSRPSSSAEVARLELDPPPLAADWPEYRGLDRRMADRTEGLTISAWDRLAQADASFEAIAPWFREMLGPILAGAPLRRAAEGPVAHQASASDRIGGLRG